LTGVWCVEIWELPRGPESLLRVFANHAETGGGIRRELKEVKGIIHHHTINADEVEWR
jgi:hypothetical protein